MNEWTEKDIKEIREWNEKDHPRDGDGKFTNGGGDTTNKKIAAIRKYSDDPDRDIAKDDTPRFGSREELDRLLGEEFTGVKGQAAVNKLLNEKRGHVKGAFHRDDIGDIDLLWGNDRVGLCHILQRRNEQGINAENFIEALSEVVKKGEFQKKNERGNFEFWHNGKVVVIAPEYHGNKITYMLTAYKRTKK